MAYTGGDVTEVSFSNEDVGTGFWDPVSGEDSTIVLGGYENEDNGAVSASGKLIVSKNRKPGSFSLPFANDMNAGTPEFEQAKALQNSTKETTFTIAFINGAVYRGQGVIVGTVELSG